MGDGDIPVVLVPGWVSNVDLYDDPTYLVRAASPSGSVGTCGWWSGTSAAPGLSDPVSHVPPIDERMDDLRAVLDAAEIEYPALVGRLRGRSDEHRVRRDVSGSGPFPGAAWAPRPGSPKSCPIFHGGYTPEQIAAGLEDIDNHWGEGALADLFFGPIADVPGVREMFGKEQRACASPMMARLDVAGGVRDRRPRCACQRPDTHPGAGPQGGPHRSLRSPLRRSPPEYRTPNCRSYRRASTTRSTWSTCFRRRC